MARKRATKKEVQAEEVIQDQVEQQEEIVKEPELVEKDTPEEWFKRNNDQLSNEYHYAVVMNFCQHFGLQAPLKCELNVYGPTDNVRDICQSIFDQQRR